jgi:hypothetical protein
MSTKSPAPRNDRHSIPAIPAKPGDTQAEPSLDERLDEALDESFPASDPPAVHSSRSSSL